MRNDISRAANVSLDPARRLSCMSKGEERRVSHAGPPGIQLTTIKEFHPPQQVRFFTNQKATSGQNKVSEASLVFQRTQHTRPFYELMLQTRRPLRAVTSWWGAPPPLIHHLLFHYYPVINYMCNKEARMYIAC
ncbi:hypothetical protein E2C01_025609 [Portunus trituberculatus]|uniref:Uncharacterized protein n=1 Tax=Portunus trituberculatus TaxID=210409 RepID=A0A5B7EGD8_PORTR|nr:hypothetical protein [Portunus trituberculatus]